MGRAEAAKNTEPVLFCQSQRFFELFGELGRRRVARVRMVVRMVPKCMTLRNNAPSDLRMLRDATAHGKKRRLSTVAGEFIKQLRRVLGMRPVIKGKEDCTVSIFDSFGQCPTGQESEQCSTHRLTQPVLLRNFQRSVRLRSSALARYRPGNPRDRTRRQPPHRVVGTHPMPATTFQLASSPEPKNGQ